MMPRSADLLEAWIASLPSKAKTLERPMAWSPGMCQGKM